jgi:hypothetical protein
MYSIGLKRMNSIKLICHNFEIEILKISEKGFLKFISLSQMFWGIFVY